jgi:3-oxoacyl-[acyl-carrier protein] reductase
MSDVIAIVTGANQGIGQATAVRLARNFSGVVLVARGRANLEQTAQTVTEAGAVPLIIDADLAVPEAAQLVVDRALAQGHLGGKIPIGDRCDSSRLYSRCGS